MTIVDYTVLSSKSLNRLVEAVKNAIGMGYVPQGGVICWTAPAKVEGVKNPRQPLETHAVFAQAMVKPANVTITHVDLGQEAANG